MVTIHSRASWGARHANGVGNRPVGSLQKYLHHTVTTHLGENATVAQERAQMRVIEAIGQQRFGRGISYTFIIFPSGRIYEGASINRISYHSGSGRNTRGAGICFAGNYETNRPGTKALAAGAGLLQEGVRRGWWNDPALTEAHRDFRQTACPGRFLYAEFDNINRSARGGSYADFKKNGLPGGTKIVPSPSKGKPATSKSTGTKSVSQMATEVIAGQHGTGHDNRRRSLGISASRYAQVRAEVNRRAGVRPAPARKATKSVAQMAAEVIDGRHGSGHTNRRRSLGVSASVYALVRAEVNRRAGGGSRRKSVSQMATEVLAGKHGNGHANRQRSLGVNNATYAQVRAEVNRRA